jgi:hypothetical protein
MSPFIHGVARYLLTPSDIKISLRRIYHPVKVICLRRRRNDGEVVRQRSGQVQCPVLQIVTVTIDALQQIDIQRVRRASVVEMWREPICPDVAATVRDQVLRCFARWS